MSPIVQSFRDLPSEIVIDILSRLPIRTILICKCVCRSWRDLISSREFVNFHLSRSVPGLVISAFLLEIEYFRIFEFDDGLGLQHHDLHYKPLIKIESSEFNRCSGIAGSANGLLMLHKQVSMEVSAFCVCNPVTCEYIELLYDMDYAYSIYAYGFGASQMTSEHKVVRILHRYKIIRAGDIFEFRNFNITMSVCFVYTLGTGKWRSIKPPAPFLYGDHWVGVHLNGNLHWLVQVSDVSNCISCFDLDTETFSTLSLPSPVGKIYFLDLVVLDDCLCVSDTTEDEVVIWLMKEYGDEKSWTKQFVFKKKHVFDVDGFIASGGYVHPIKLFKDGYILMAVQHMFLIYHSNKTKTGEQVEVLKNYREDLYVRCLGAMLHNSSFFSLSSFVNERVSRFGCSVIRYF